MTTLLSYALTADTPPFPERALDPLAYKLEAFDDPAQALRKARYVASHSQVHHLALWTLQPALDDAQVREWISRHPDPALGAASEAHGVTAQPQPRVTE
jgi:hypothetical protein